jgi:hypothetical protein
MDIAASGLGPTLLIIVSIASLLACIVTGLIALRNRRR